jgi:2-C-methyl-D-erythritol 2,4-cyclodiphosphate synthase
VPGRRLILGGVEVPHDAGLEGHSDADVLLHAVMDALLGAMGLGDIGKHFPNTDPRYKNISSVLLLKEIGQLLLRNHYIVGNIDSSLILDSPRVAPYVDQMRNNIASTLGITADRVSVKATTSEGLGFIGAGQGIAAHAIALLIQR